MELELLIKMKESQKHLKALEMQSSPKADVSIIKKKNNVIKAKLCEYTLTSTIQGYCHNRVQSHLPVVVIVSLSSQNSLVSSETSF